MYFAVLCFEFVIVAIALSAVSLIWYGVPAWREGLNRWIIKLFSWRAWRPGWGLLVLLIPWIMIATIALVSTVENYPKMTDARDVMRFFMSTLRDATYYAEGYTEEKFNESGRSVCNSRGTVREVSLQKIPMCLRCSRRK